MISREEFDVVFNKLVADEWTPQLYMQKVPHMKTVYYEKLSCYSFTVLSRAVENILQDPEQRCFPSRHGLDMEVARIMELPKAGYSKPRLAIVRTNKQKEKIKNILTETKKLVVKYKGKPEILRQKLGELSK